MQKSAEAIVGSDPEGPNNKAESKTDDFHAKLGALIDLGRPSSGRFKTADLTQFVPDDISYIGELGYVV